MECIRCGNTELALFYKHNDTYYCRKCIMFGRIDIGNELVSTKLNKVNINYTYQLPFKLTEAQISASKALIEYLSLKQNCLVFAACGAGKTEIAMEAINHFLNKGLKIGFAIARRQVVLEIAERLTSCFSCKVVAVCEGYREELDGDIIVCTMHQLYRYYQAFDLLIMDEVDAFPYKGNLMLEKIAKQSCKGLIVYLTATPTAEMLKQVANNELALIKLFARPHGFPIVVPKIYWLPKSLHLITLFIFLNKQAKLKQQTMVFVPTKKAAKRLNYWCKLFYRCNYVTSNRNNKDEIIKQFKAKALDILITTTLMERGITIENVQVIILDCAHPVFDSASIMQISGRVGRKASAPSGDCWLVTNYLSPAINEALANLLMMNKKTNS